MDGTESLPKTQPEINPLTPEETERLLNTHLDYKNRNGVSCNDLDFKNLTFKFFPDYVQAANALKGQAVSALSFAPRDIVDKIGIKNFQLQKFKLPQYTALFFNQEQKTELKDIEMRKALNLGIDKEKIISEALNSEAEAVNSPILKNHTGYYPNLETLKFNVEKAVQLLDKNSKRIQPEEYFNIAFDAALKNSGPLPPEVEEPTTYTITWSVLNSSNTLRDAVVKTVLPPYVNWKNVQSPQTAELTFNPISREVVWRLGRVLPEATAKELSFQVELVPSLSQVGSSPALSGPVKLSAFDTFTETVVESESAAVTTELKTDQNYKLPESKIAP